MTVRPPVFLPLLLLAILLSACGLLREPEEASGTIEAIPLDVTEQAAAAATAETTDTMGNASQDSQVTPSAPPNANEKAPVTGEEDEEPAGVRIYQISQIDSEVRFEIDEELRGQPKTVIGVTDQVAGEIALDLSDLSATQIGVIQINARTLRTDSDRRDRAIHNEILDTADHEFITFTPEVIKGLPAVAGSGDELAFTVEGNLTIRDITQPATFDVVATVVSETEVRGTATTTISREVYGLRIPSVPMVANVEEEVELFIDFVAQTG